MTLNILRLLLDFGTLILIWLVQLVIYPSFCHFAQADLKRWHKIYTTQVSIMIMPLMLGQVGSAAIQLYTSQNIYTIGSALIIFLLWASTFYQFVPLHNSIGREVSCEGITSKLVKLNWIRTTLWTGLFLWTFSRFF